MATLREILRRINGVKSTSKVTQAMRMISAVKLRKAQGAIVSARPYFEKLGEVLSNLVVSVGEDYSNELILRHKSVNSILLIVIAGDRGLCGGFNNSLFRMATQFIETDLHKEYPNAKISIIPVGKIACAYFKKSSYHVIKDFPAIFSNLQFSYAKEITDIAKNKYSKNEIDRVYIVNNNFKNLISQVPTITTLLPIEQKLTKEDNAKNQFNVDYIFEPDQQSILDDLLPRHIDIQLWRTILESSAAEQAARMMAMENATNNANELVKNLELVYNKERQSSITTEMLEIVSGANALKRN